MKERKPYSSNVSDGEWNFVAPYVALVTERVPTLCANCLTHCVGWCGVADATECFASVVGGLSTNATVVEEEIFPRPASMICANPTG